MSREDVDVVRGVFQAFARRDLHGVSRWADPHVVVRPGLVGGPEGADYQGHAGFAQWWADIDRAWAEFRAEPDEFRDLGGGRVLVLGRAFARGRMSDIAVDSPAAWLAFVRDGRLRRFQSFNSHEQGLEAAGLRD